jgi:hypothetical protein
MKKTFQTFLFFYVIFSSEKINGPNYLRNVKKCQKSLFYSLSGLRIGSDDSLSEMGDKFPYMGAPSNTYPETARGRAAPYIIPFALARVR